MIKEPRFTVYGDAACEAKIAQELTLLNRQISSVVGEHRLAAIVLMGGYGRGEGGVQKVRGALLPHNNYDVLLVLSDRPPVGQYGLKSRLAKLGQSLRPQLSVPVDFSCLTKADLHSSRFRLLLCDTQHASRVLWGDPKVLENLPPMPLEQVPMIEGLWLLLNRCTLLLLNEYNHFIHGPLLQEHHHGVVLRHIAKAILGCGDAILIALGQYHWSYLEKRRRLTNLEKDQTCPVPGIGQAYAQALEWRLAPSDVPWNREALEETQQDAHRFAGRCYLWFEKYRLGQEDLSWDGYSMAFADQLPALQEAYAATLLRPGWRRGIYPMATALYGLLVGVATLGMRGVLAGGQRWALLHPRNRLLASFPLLAFSPSLPVGTLRSLLCVPGPDRLRFLQGYMDLWKRFCA